MVRQETFANLNTEAPGEVAEFERALYQAFAKSLATDPIVKYVWDVDVPAQRIRTKVPYTRQLIHVARLDGVIAAAGAANLDLTGPWQLDMLGFTIDKTQPHICEALMIFNNQRDFGEQSMSLFETVGREMVAQLKRAHGIRRVYGSCPPSKLQGYLLYGWREIGSRVIEGCQELLLEAII
jgi:hypothetical protein